MLLDGCEVPQSDWRSRGSRVWPAQDLSRAPECRGRPSDHQQRGLGRGVAEDDLYVYPDEEEASTLWD